MDFLSAGEHVRNSAEREREREREKRERDRVIISDHK